MSRAGGCFCHIFSQSLHLQAACIFSLDASAFAIRAQTLHIFAYYPRTCGAQFSVLTVYPYGFTLLSLYGFTSRSLLFYKFKLIL